MTKNGGLSAPELNGQSRAMSRFAGKRQVDWENLFSLRTTQSRRCHCHGQGAALTQAIDSSKYTQVVVMQVAVYNDQVQLVSRRLGREWGSTVCDYAYEAVA